MATALNLQAWSTTAADNDDADSAINWLEGQDPGTVNGSARGMMSAIRRYASDVGGGIVAAGTANAITLTTLQVLSAAHIAAGLTLKFRATATNTGAVTFAPDGLSAVAVVDQYGNALTAGAIVSGAIVELSYNANTSNWRLVSGGGAALFPSARASFSAHKNGSGQTAAVGDIITFGTELFDVGSAFASNAWTPPAGTALITANVTIALLPGERGGIALYKDGAVLHRGGNQFADVNGNGDSSASGAWVVQTSGSNVFTLRYVGNASGDISGIASATMFSGTMI